MIAPDASTRPEGSGSHHRSETARPVEAACFCAIPRFPKPQNLSFRPSVASGEISCREALHVSGAPFSSGRVGLPLSTVYPRGATSNIVGPKHSAGMNALASNNIGNGTSTARGPFPQTLPGRRHSVQCLPAPSRLPEGFRIKQCKGRHLRRTGWRRTRRRPRGGNGAADSRRMLMQLNIRLARKKVFEPSSIVRIVDIGSLVSNTASQN